jgi:hypothetical protein
VAPDLRAGREMVAPISRPIPVKRNGGISESNVARDAKVAQSETAPRVKRFAFIPKVYGTKLAPKVDKKSLKNILKIKKIFKKYPLHASIGVDWCLFHS